MDDVKIGSIVFTGNPKEFRVVERIDVEYDGKVYAFTTRKKDAAFVSFDESDLKSNYTILICE